jgi:glycosyltransferase involved in cell wall biosynthesis
MGDKDKPLVSIITVCLNSEKTIEQTIQSVINQTYPNIEYIIIDGKSTDGTLDIINKYKDKISILVSEKDKGIYNAMNKGLTQATGEVIYFLQSDDYLFNDSVIERVMDEFIKYPETQIIYGDLVVAMKNRNYVASYKRITNYYYLYRRGISQQAIFANRAVFAKTGLFDERYNICADYDWFLKCLIKYNIKSKYIGEIITVFSGLGASSVYDTSKESEAIKNKYFTKKYFVIWKLIAKISQLMYSSKILSCLARNLRRI